MSLFIKRQPTQGEVLLPLVMAQDLKACQAYLQLFLDGEPIEQWDILRALTVVTMAAVRSGS
jgi:hypothetical protein